MLTVTVTVLNNTCDILFLNLCLSGLRGFRGRSRLYEAELKVLYFVPFEQKGFGKTNPYV